MVRTANAGGATKKIETICGGFHFNEGSPALEMRFECPQGVAADSAGNVYIADKTVGRVYVKRPDGKLYAFAGTGTTEFGGDGKPATQAQLHQIYGLAVGNAGELYISDCGNRRIRVVGKAGFIRTVIGTGAQESLALSKFPKEGLPANQVPLADPFVLHYEQQNKKLWISDCGGRRVYCYDPASNLIRVVVSAENGGPEYPSGIAIVGRQLIVADRIVKRLMIMNLDSGKIESWIGGVRDRPRLDFVMPVGLAYDGSKFLYVTDQFDGKIHRIEVATKKVELFAGGGTKLESGAKGVDLTLKFPSLTGWLPDGRLLVSEVGQHRCVLAFSRDGIAEIIAGKHWGEFDGSKIGDGGATKSAVLFSPRGLAINKAGDIFVSDCNHRRVRKISRKTNTIETLVGRPGWPRLDLPWPRRANADGDPKACFLISPRGLALDAAENLYVIDVNHRAILKLDATGKKITSVIQDDRMQSPTNLVLGKAGELYVDDPEAHVIWRVDPQGKLDVFAGTPGKSGYAGDSGAPGQALLFSPTGVAIGRDGEIYIGDTNNQRVRVVRNGKIETFAGTGRQGDGAAAGPALAAALDRPRVLGVDANGDLYLTDGSRRLIKIERATSIIEPVAGGAQYGYRGDGGPAVDAAQMKEPHAIAFFGEEIYLADSENHAVRKIWS